MKIRTDFVTNSSSSSFITIVTTKTDGTTIEDTLESSGPAKEQIYFNPDMSNIVQSDTPNGEAVLKNIQKMYMNPRIDYLLDDSDQKYLLREIDDLSTVEKIEITEEIVGDVLEMICCETEEGEVCYPETSKVKVLYNVQKEQYSKPVFTAEDEDGNALVILNDDEEVEVSLSNQSEATNSIVESTKEDPKELFDGQVSDDGTVYIITDLKKKMADVNIPGMIDGLPVYIGCYSFNNIKQLENVTFEEGVVGLGAECFADCKSLKNVTLAKSINIIESNVFFDTPWKKSLGDWMIINNILVEYSGSECEVIVPQGVKIIGESAFAFNEDITKVVLPESVKVIGSGAFDGCENLLEIDVPESVVEFGTRPFEDTEFEREQESWLIINGVLCGVGKEFADGDDFGDDAELVIPDGIHTIAGNLFPSFSKIIKVSSVLIPDGVRTLGRFLFSGFNNLKCIKLPDSLEKIEYSCFSYCENLHEIRIPESVKEIESGAFCNYHNITIYAKKGSYAERYAMENNIPFAEE